jgi:hypothetical protein
MPRRRQRRAAPLFERAMPLPMPMPPLRLPLFRRERQRDAAANVFA